MALTIKLLQVTGNKGSNTTFNDTVTGTAAADQTVTIYADGTSIGTAVANASGAWTYTPVGLTAGLQTLSVDTGAYTPSDPSVAFTYIPTGSTTIQLVDDTGGSDLDTSVDELAGTGGLPNSYLSLYEDSTFVATVSVNAAGDWTYQPVGLTQGAHSFAVYDNAHGGSQITFTYDTHPPTVTVAAQTTGDAYGTAEVGEPVTVIYDGVSLGTATVAGAIPGTEGTWVFDPSPTLSDGIYTVVASETDGAGNIGTATTTIDVKTGAPTIRLQLDSGIPGDFVTNDDVLVGLGTANSTLTIDENGVSVGVASVNAGGNWTYTPVGLANGAVSFTAVDSTNSTSASIYFTYDTTPPYVTAAHSPTVPGDIGGFYTPGDTLDLIVNGVNEGAPTLVTTPTTMYWTYTADNLPGPALNTATIVETNYVGNTGVATTTWVACYLAGTRLRTPIGWVEVQDIAAGDTLLTTDGTHETVRWVGHHAHSLRSAMANPKLTPVLIRQGAFAEAVPVRDLFVSPDHAVLFDGVLVQAGALVNDSSILHAAPDVQEVAYYHVELGCHALLLAEDLPAESFIDNINRPAFDNWDSRDAGVAPIAEMELPRAKSWRQVPRRSREALEARGQALFGAAQQAA